MRKVKILHCADLHFDTQMSNLSKNDLLEVFSNIIKLAKKEAVEIMLIAGDVFDNLSVNKETLRFLELTFATVPNIKIFISPGNHDPYNAKSFYNLVDWPENVHIFKGDIEKVFIKELNTNVYGAAFNSNYIKESNLKMQSEDGKINIMVLHAELSSGTSVNEYNPVTLDDIANSNLDYLALGHRHAFSGIQKSGTTYYAYSGCPQGRGFDELGDKGIIIGEVYEDGVNLDFVKTSRRLYIEKNIDISNSHSYMEIKSTILNNISKSERESNLYKIILQGELNEEFILDEGVMNGLLKDDFYFAKVYDKTEVKYNYDELVASNSIKGTFVKKMFDKIANTDSEEEKELIKLAMKMGLKALSEEEVNMGDY